MVHIVKCSHPHESRQDNSGNSRRAPPVAGVLRTRRRQSLGYNITYCNAYGQGVWPCAPRSRKDCQVMPVKPDPSAGAVVTLHSESAARTRRLGAVLGKLLRSGDVVLL